MENFLQILTSENLENSGAILVALVALFLMFYLVKSFNRTIGNHLHTAEENRKDDIKSRELLSLVLGKILERVEDLPKKE